MDLVREHKPNILLFGATMKGRELAPRIASEKMAGLTADCTDLQIDDFEDLRNHKSYKNKLMQIRPAFGGNIIATIVNTWDDPQIVTVREGVMKIGTPVPGRKGEVVHVDVALTEKETIVKVMERIRQDKPVNRKGAQIIVSGGWSFPCCSGCRMDQSRSSGRTDRCYCSSETLYCLRHQRICTTLRRNV